MHGLDIGGEVNIAAGIQVAQLALKHRQNKKQQQRIIVFTGGPVKYEKKVLEMIGRKLKKNSVALDAVNFGEEDEAKTEKLEALVSAVNNESSHIVHVPSGASTLSDVLISTPIFTGDGEGGSGLAAAAVAAGGVSGFDFDVDPNVDPELALALRVSMEEERARQEEAAKKAADEALNQEKRGEQASTSQDIIMSALTSSEADNNTADLMARGLKKHLKRLNAPKHWMLDKLGGAFAPKPSSGPHKSRECLPLILILRNKLKDLKIENTLLDGSPAPRLKICDFGYSKSSLLHSRPKNLEQLRTCVVDIVELKSDKWTRLPYPYEDA